jgi:RNA polymerase sigma factor (sigma-70 family)
MTPVDATCWTLIHAAAAGDRLARESFARLYEPIARAYFRARWSRSSCLGFLDDAVQDVFVECFKSEGVLDKVTATQPPDFRAFYYGVLRNIALRHETKRPAIPLPAEVPAEDTSLSRTFDKAWARSLLKEAARLQSQSAMDPRAVQRVELLRLRFQEGLPIREIAQRWQQDTETLHHEYARAREEFRAALQKLMAFHQPTASPAQLETLCRELLSLVQ